MITKNELYFLNRALDGEEIYGLPRGNDILASMRSMENAKASLIEKSMLNTDESINDLTFLILRNLEIYKNSKSYIWINDIVASIDASNYMIFFKKEDDGLEFKKTTKEMMLFAMVKQYEFLWDNKEVKVNTREVTLDDFMNEYLDEKDATDVLFIRREIEGNIAIYNVYFVDENKEVFKYDVLREKLANINPRDIRLELGEIFDILWDGDSINE